MEGDTEYEFIRNVLYPYLIEKGVNNVRVITIETSPGSKGGDVRYFARYKYNIQILLSGKEEMIVTSLINFYRLSTDFPNYRDSLILPIAEMKINMIEKACSKDIDDNRFIPYIQLHEFEGLLFSSKKGFEQLFPDMAASDRRNLTDIIDQYPNPELINDRPEFAPSVRLKKLIPKYDKPFDGNMIALENGIEVILEKCPRFKNWVETLIQRMTE